MKKSVSYYFYAGLCVFFILSVVTLFIDIQSGFGSEDVVIYKPNDDVLFNMTLSQAKQMIKSKENRHEPVPTLHNVHPMRGELIRGIEISSDKVTWIDDVENGIFYIYTAYLKSTDISVVKYKGQFKGFMVRISHGRFEPHGGNWSSSKAKEERVRFWITYDRNESVSLANAFYVLKRFAEGYNPQADANASSFADFQEKAKAWRELSVKPDLPEDVQRCRVVAEDALRNKEFEKAIKYYKEGLTIEPLWPQGQFNAAILEGELHWYKSAIINMKRYLELVPNAPNAMSAREKMYLWEEKAKEAGTQEFSNGEMETK